MNRVPVGVVGVGALGRHHARHFAAQHGAELVGVFDASPQRASEVATQVGTRAFASLDELLGAVQAVSIAVPTTMHRDVGLECLGRGVSVLMEKPLAQSLAEADELLAEGARHDLVLPSGISSASMAPCALRSSISTSHSFSRAFGSRHFSRAAPTWPSCSTS